tara:strand:- start:494 stop:1276 length:783 start_codon:yes stop_codon:yes gene_type:complete
MHLSFSGIKDWKFCPFYYKLTRIDKLKAFQGNIYTAFGTALHTLCENAVLKENNVKHEELFEKQYFIEMSKLPPEVIEEYDEDMYYQFLEQGKKISHLIYPELKNKFGDFKVVDAEYEIREKIRNLDFDTTSQYDFVGYVDLIIKTGDTYHVIDWKTCSWGWDARKKADTMTTYQLSYYKHFVSEALGVPKENIKTYFALLKRTAKKDNVEFVEVSNGEKKINNALKMLSDAVYNVDSERWLKNRLSCRTCAFHRTEHCP